MFLHLLFCPFNYGSFSLNVSEIINPEKFVLAVIQTTVLDCTCTEESEPSLTEAHILFYNLFYSNSIFLCIPCAPTLTVQRTLCNLSFSDTVWCCSAQTLAICCFVVLILRLFLMEYFLLFVFLCVEHTRAVGRFTHSGVIPYCFVVFVQ